MTESFAGPDPIRLEGGEGQPKLRELLEFVRTAYEQGQLTLTKTFSDDVDGATATLSITAPKLTSDRSGDQTAALSKYIVDLRP